MNKVWKVLVILIFILWKIYCIPGFVFVWLCYLFPSKGRYHLETIKEYRQYKNIHIFAPLYSLVAWFLIFHYFSGQLF